jgi:two-component system, cell cycle sensor histidine kinase PleC
LAAFCRGMLRLFAILSLVLLAAVATAVGYLQRDVTLRDLRAVNDETNRSLLQAFVNTHGALIAAATAGSEHDAATLRARPETAAFDRAVRAFFNGVPVLKIKLYDLQGMTVYSSETRQIGEDKADNGGFRSALGGKPISDMYFRGKFNAFEGVVSDRNLFATYMPVRRDGAIAAVIEVYRDITPLMLVREQELRSLMIQIGGLFAALYVILLLIVLQADRAVRCQLDAARASEARLADSNRELHAAKEAAEAANRAKSMFLANMSHELRTPLNAVIGFAQMMANETWGPLGSPKYRGYADDIARSGAHLLGILDDLLDMSRVEAGKLQLVPERLEPGTTIDEAVRYVTAAAAAGQVALTVNVPALPAVELDRLRFRQILVNILSNAVKYTPGGGAVQVSGAAIEGWLQIEVTDTGIGMSPADMAVALTPFGQVRDDATRGIPGIGLGLPLTKALTEMLGGSLSMSSEQGKGTAVTLRFPLAARLAAAA